MQSLTITVAQLAPIVSNPDTGYTFKYTNFGEVLLGADVDGDGFNDLVVGAPMADPDVSSNQVTPVQPADAEEKRGGTGLTAGPRRVHTVRDSAAKCTSTWPPRRCAARSTRSRAPACASRARRTSSGSAPRSPLPSSTASAWCVPRATAGQAHSTVVH